MLRKLIVNLHHMGWEWVTNSISLVLCKAQLPTDSRAFALSKVLISSNTKLPLMGLSAPSRSKGGTGPTVLSCFMCTAPLIVFVSQMCSTHTAANNRPPTRVFSNIFYRFWFPSSHPTPTETQPILWGVRDRGKRHAQPGKLTGQEVALLPACRRALVMW